MYCLHFWGENTMQSTKQGVGQRSHWSKWQNVVIVHPELVELCDPCQKFSRIYKCQQCMDVKVSSRHAAKSLNPISVNAILLFSPDRHVEHEGDWTSRTRRCSSKQKNLHANSGVRKRLHCLIRWFASQSRPFVRAMAPRMAEHKTVDSVTRSKRLCVFCGILCQVQHQSLIEWLLSNYFTIIRSHANGSDGIGWNSVEIPVAFTDLSMMSDSAVGKWRQDTGQQGTSRRGLGILCDTLALASTLKKP